MNYYSISAIELDCSAIIYDHKQYWNLKTKEQKLMKCHQETKPAGFPEMTQHCGLLKFQVRLYIKVIFVSLI